MNGLRYRGSRQLYPLHGGTVVDFGDWRVLVVEETRRLKRYPGCLVFMSLLAGILAAQDGVARHNLEVGGGGVFPLSGWKASEYSAGPALHVGNQVRLQKYLAAEAGWTGSWLPGTSCSRYGCEHPRGEVGYLDYGLRGIVSVATGRVELSAGLGGGYIWYGPDDSYFNRLAATVLRQGGRSGRSSQALPRGLHHTHLARSRAADSAMALHHRERVLWLGRGAVG